jgi:DHA1 family bicyclomycin/chloramphenicol resistance-like MFS transporter
MGLVVGILVIASSTSIMSTDMYAPSLPDLAKWFETDATRVQLTISLNLLAFGLAQLVHGPLSDRFGRRPVLLASLGAVACLCIVCAFAQSIDQLIVARVLLGIAAAAEAVVGLAIIKDLYDETEQMRALALLGMVIAITPAAAPILGGYLHVHLGWQSNFYVIAAMAVLSLCIVLRYLPESTTPDPKALQPRRVLTGYFRLLGNAEFVIHSMMLGISLGLIFVFVTGAPFVLIEQHGVPPDRFGWYQAAIVVAFFFGSLLASRVAGYWPSERLLRAGVLTIVTGAAVLCVVIFGGFETPVRLTGSYMIMTFGMGCVFSSAPSRALRSIDEGAGTASALLSGIEQTLAGIAAVAISLLNNGTSSPLAWLSLVLASGLFLLWRRSLSLVPRAP